MFEDGVLVQISARREKEEIVYNVECSDSLSNEEFEYYLGEMVKGICEWKEDICKENIRGYTGKIKKIKK